MLIEEIISEIRAEPYPYAVNETDNFSYHEIMASFETRDRSDIMVELYAQKRGTLNITFDRNGDYDITGAGDQFRILVTVLKIIETYVPKLSEVANQVLFSADLSEPSRVKLYQNRLVPIIDRLLGAGWSKQPPVNNGFVQSFTWGRDEQLTESNMRISEITQLSEDGVSYETTMRGIIEVLESISPLYHQLKLAAEQHYKNHSPGDRDTWPVRKGSITGRWKSTFWDRNLQSYLEDLVKYKSTQCAELKKYLSALDGSDSADRMRFNNMEKLLPNILSDVGKKLKNPRLKNLAENWTRQYTKFEDYRFKLKDQAETERTVSEPKSEPKPKDKTGEQTHQAMEIINFVLGNLPDKTAHEIRKAISRSDNKLQALQSELAKRDIKLQG